MNYLTQTARNLDLIERYATDEANFVWFDWGRDFAAWVPSQRCLIYNQEVYDLSFAQACDYVADLIREDKE
jgi:hypothetical protein